MHSNRSSLKQMLTVSFVFFILSQFVAAQDLKVTLKEGLPGGRYLVRAGFVAPSGVYPPDCFILATGGAKQTHPQVAVLSNWPDGSLRQLRLTFPLKLIPKKSQRVRISFSKKKPETSSSSTPFVVTPFDDGLQIKNSELRFRVSSDPGEILRDLGFSGQKKALIKVVSMGEGRGEARWKVEENGPYVLVLCQRGLVANGPKEPGVKFRRRIFLFAGCLEIAVETYLSPLKHELPKGGFDVCYELNDRITALDEKDRVHRIRKSIFPVRYQVKADGFRRFSDNSKELEPIDDHLRFMTKGGEIDVYLPDMGLLTPSFQSLDTGFAGRLSVVSSQYRWHPGVRPGRIFSLSIAKRRRRKRKPSFLGCARIELLARGSKHSGKIKGAPLRNELDLKELFLDVVRAETDRGRLKRRGYIWAGEENLGDWRWSKSDAGNLEYDTIWGMRMAATYLQDPTLLDLSRRAAQHLLQRDLGPDGLPLKHGAHHRYGGWEAGHMWLDGLIAETQATGSPFLWEDSQEVIDSWCRAAPRIARRFLNTRSLAWSMLLAGAIADAENRPVATEALGQLNRRLIDAPGVIVPLFDSVMDKDGLYRVTPWVVVGILGEALSKSPSASGQMGAVARFLRSVDFVYEQGWRGPDLGLAASIVIEASGSEPLYVRGQATGEEALFFALGLCRAAQFSNDPKYLAWAKEVCLWAHENLVVGQGRFAGLALSQLLWVFPRLFVSP